MLLRSRNHLQLLVIAAVFGVPVSAAAYGASPVDGFKVHGAPTGVTQRMAAAFTAAPRGS
jgi:hypothetical protein